MNIEEFEKQLKFINLNGITLNIEERMQLQLSFDQIKTDFDISELFFWGKLIGNTLSTLC